MAKGLVDELRKLLRQAEKEEKQEDSPTLRQLWGRVDNRPGYVDLQPGYWQIDGEKLSSANRTDLAWRNMSGLEIRGVLVADTKATDVTVDWVEELRRKMHDRITYRKKPPRNGTINRELEVLARLLNWAHRHQKIAYNPLPTLTKEDERDGIPKTKIRYESELQKLLAGCRENKMLKAIILVLYDGGLRRAECFNLRRDQVVRKANGGGVIELGVIETKTSDARRPRITKRAMDALDELPNYGPCFFCKPNGDRYHPRYLYELYCEAVERSGLQGVNGEHITIHTLRHSCMYVSRARGVPWVVQKKQQGWKTDSTPQRYGCPDDDEQDHWMDNVVEVKIAEAAQRLGPRRVDLNAAQNAELQKIDSGK